MPETHALAHARPTPSGPASSIAVPEIHALAQAQAGRPS
jgi:hypothetical protein